MKIKLQSIEDACDCPFYVLSSKSKRFCFIKQNMSPAQSMALVEENQDFDPLSWNEDCQGKFENCAIVSLLYNVKDISSPKEEIIAPPDLESIEDYNPFEEYSEEEDEQEETEETEPEDLIFVKIVGVDNVYSVKADALIYPNNQILQIDDDELNRRSYNKIQDELDKIVPPVSLGTVFQTGNGGDHKGGIKAKKIYHAVVATQSRLVNETAIIKSVVKSLTQADEDGCETVVMLPMDCGTFDLHATAYAQLNAIYKFLETVNAKNLKNIFIITTKNDKVTLDIFNEKFDRIFGEE
jgi:hypothetical protein